MKRWLKRLYYELFPWMRNDWYVANETLTESMCRRHFLSNNRQGYRWLGERFVSALEESIEDSIKKEIEELGGISELRETRLADKTVVQYRSEA